MSAFPYFAAHRPVNHEAPAIGERFDYDEVDRGLKFTELHGNCTILTCPRRAVFKALQADMDKRGLGSARVTAEMLPT